MEVLRATYGSDDEEEEEVVVKPPAKRPASSAVSNFDGGGAHQRREHSNAKESNLLSPPPLPPPPLDLLRPPNSLDISVAAQANRIRSFPHVEGNYALHIYIPVVIPTTTRLQLVSYVNKIAFLEPDLYAVDIDYAISELRKNGIKLEEALFGRAFHISLGRTVPIQVHQIDSIVTMLHHKLHSQRQFWIEFNKWDTFVNDDQTRTFLSLEILGTGLLEITKQIHIVDEVYRLHGLPEFYKNPRPHISLLWTHGDLSNRLSQVLEKLDKASRNGNSSQSHIFTCKFSGIECKIGKKTYNICNFPD